MKNHRKLLRKRCRLALCVSLLWSGPILSGCATRFPTPLPSEHVVMVNDLGTPVNPQGNWFEPPLVPGRPPSERWHRENWHVPFLPYHPLSADEYIQYLDELLRKLAAHPKDPMTGKRKILLFVHGGLNRASTSLGRVTELADRIKQDGYFPIFIVWDSSLFSNWIDSLVLIRQGRLAYDRYSQTRNFLPRATSPEEKKLYSWVPGLLTVVPIIIRDTVRGVVRGIWDTILLRWGIILADARPTTDERPAAIGLLGKIEEPVPTESPCLIKGRTQRSSELLCEYEPFRGRKESLPDNVFPVLEGKDLRDGSENILNELSLLLGSPLGFLSTVILDFGGPGAWDMMLRRTALLFHADADFLAPDPHRPAHGGIALLLAGLQSYIKYHGGKEKWDITLVGHSMGTIVVNHMIRLYGDSFREARLPMFDKIVYMAAACSLRDYQDAVFPYLKTYTGQKINNPNKEEPQIYHLMLHASADLQEPHYWELSRGSLLLWVDELFTNPQYHLDRVAGFYNNFIEAIHLTPDEVRNHISIKAFSYGNTEGDQPSTSR
jgi:pimeloyl-ACP methyl ester carboxylesterase